MPPKKSSFPLSLLLASTTLTLSALASQSGVTTRYWDCCKGSCGWTGKANVSNPITSCSAQDTPLTGYDAKNGCESGGTAFMCSTQTPWAVNDALALGFAAVNIGGGTESSWCCACYKLTFTSGPVVGKTMIVQATNTGGDLGSNHFDIAMPGGGVGIFNGCTSEWGAPSGGWGAQYGGISTRSQCDSFPAALQPGCYWRFDWFLNADNPSITFDQVTCPKELTDKTGCIRSGETPVAIGNPATTGGVGASVATSLSTSTIKAGSSTAAAATTTSAAGGTVAQWGQCGGLTYSGPTQCVSGTTCVVINSYYSQCQ